MYRGDGRDLLREKFRVNERIKSPQVRVLNEEGRQIGIMIPEEALRLAREAGLDLVEIAPEANPPVCKIIDFGKFLYQLAKKEKQQRKKMASQLKEIRFSVKISEHDYSYKVKHIREFLEDGDKVKVVVLFKGREIVHSEKGFEVMGKVINDVADIGKPVNEPRLIGRTISVVITPSKGENKKSVREVKENIKE